MDIVVNIMRIIEKESDIPAAEMSPDSALMDDLDLSSFELVAIITALQDMYSVDIPFQNVVTINDLAEVIEEQLD